MQTFELQGPLKTCLFYLVDDDTVKTVMFSHLENNLEAHVYVVMAYKEVVPIQNLKRTYDEALSCAIAVHQAKVRDTRSRHARERSELNESARNLVRQYKGSAREKTALLGELLFADDECVREIKT